MLPPAHRLRHSADVERARQGRSWHHPLVILLVQKNSENSSRFAFLASRRVGKAVHRNRTKRLMREAVRCHLPAIEAGWDCLLIARTATTAATFVQVETAVLQLLGRAHLLVEQA